MLFAFAIIDRLKAEGETPASFSPFPPGLGFNLLEAENEAMAWKSSRLEFPINRFSLELVLKLSNRDAGVLLGSSTMPLKSPRTRDNIKTVWDYDENATGHLNAWNVSAALRYAEAEYGDDLTFLERATLERAARKIEKKFETKIGLNMA